MRRGAGERINLGPREFAAGASSVAGGHASAPAASAVLLEPSW